ncbi:Tol [Fusarium pseudocircinatum]|uniref:Tol n=1 Tax=Fusarium pseudocircinatum TaxID=56676 RepID=A0A8H5PKB6_9HYPO|nr:Tol [Fusarium pseudocircinatum]
MSLQGQHRHITLRHERHLLRGTSPALAPGEARFSSYYLPSLPAGEYSISIDQTITTPTKDPPKKAEPAKRKIEVLAPEWALSAASNGDSETANASDEESAVVLSVFPASGHVAPSFRTLPHMVLRDAQLPWVRNVSKKNTGEHSKIPWFALIVFSADELELDEKDGKDYFGPANASINDTLGWDLTVDQIEQIKSDGGLANIIPKPLLPDIQAHTRTSLLAVKTEVFKKLFPPKKGESTFDVAPYTFMSHVRTVATEGTLSAGVVADNDHDPKLAGTQTLSVIVSHRLGPTTVQVPTPVLAHLVSLQGIDGRPISDVDGKRHVLMTSLFSWTYTALPPGAPDVVSMLQYLGSEGKGLAVLRTDMAAGHKAKSMEGSSKPSVEEMVTMRQKDGYNLVRHRVITGEQTAAMYRGPLTPTIVLHPLNGKVSFQSNFGTDLQILDPDLGLMDISYASAWQLGKTLAMADPAFTAALSRLRMLVHREALEKGRKKVVETLRAPVFSTNEGVSRVKKRMSVFSDQNPHVNYVPKEEIKSDMAQIVGALNGINETMHEVGTAFSTNRWRRRGPVSQPLSDNEDMSITSGLGQGHADDFISLLSDHIYSQMPEHALFHMLDNAGTPDEKGPHNYHTIPNNTDYSVIQEWILNKLHLSGIPAHYYLPDPSYVPEETLRFFHIDLNWMDALIDGALSLANHLASTPAEDYCRSALKQALNEYFKKPITADYCQQNPTYGFILRSKLLVQFPDLAVKAEFSKNSVHSNEDWDKVKPKAPILVQRRLGPDMMLVLMDREPPSLSGVTFTLPAHQQTFIAAFQLSKEEVELQCKRIYATGADEPLPQPDWETRKSLIQPKLNPRPTIELFDWDARTLRVEEYAKLIHENLRTQMSKEYLADGPSSAVFSLQLNEPIYTLSVTAERPKLPKNATQEELDSWMILHEPKTFQFYPPAFPTDRFKAKKPLLNASTLPKPPSFPATRLKVTESAFVKLEPTVKESTINGSEEFTIIGETPALDNIIEIPPILGGPIQPTDQPIFNFGLFPIGKKDDGFIPCKNDRPIDLIFSIVRDANTRPDVWPMRILSWDLEIKIGDPDHPPNIPPDYYGKPRALLCNDGKDGPPPTMLSNLRYNVLIQKWDLTANMLYISIVPRSKWGVHLKDTPDASFLLPMANVFPWDVPKGKDYTVQVGLKSTMINHGRNSKQEITYDHTKQFKLRAA